MAWRAELKRKNWYCIKGFDMISWYHRFLYDEWYNSLTEEEKMKLEERRRKKKEQDEKEAHDAVMRLLTISAMMAGVNARNYNQRKYHGVYDENGFPCI